VSLVCCPYPDGTHGALLDQRIRIVCRSPLAASPLVGRRRSGGNSLSGLRPIAALCVSGYATTDVPTSLTPKPGRHTPVAYTMDALSSIAPMPRLASYCGLMVNGARTS